MRPVLYFWKHMVRDYTRLMLDDKWYFCRHCRRPVEHAMVARAEGEPELKALACLDCGCTTPDVLPARSKHGSNSERHGTGF